MSGNDKRERHADLVDRMADTQGVDLLEAQLRGDITPEEIQDSVLICLGCSETAACERWLKLNKDGADATPGYCRNQAVFKSLKGDQNTP